MLDKPQFYMIKLAPQIGNKSIHFQFENKNIQFVLGLGILPNCLKLPAFKPSVVGVGNCILVSLFAWHIYATNIKTITNRF